MGRHRVKVTDPKTATEELVMTAIALFTVPFDDRKGRDSSLPTLRSVAEQLNTTILRTRKLLITGNYFTTAISRHISSLVEEGKSIEEIMVITGLGKASVYSYLPYKGIAFNLPTTQTTSNADRHRLYRRRKKAVEVLQNNPSSLNLWQCIILFQNYPFSTSGRGKREGVKFKYTVQEDPGNSGKKYSGQSVDGWGNELFIGGHEKSITRSSVDYAINLVLTTTITGPKSLKIFGSSYVYAIFHRFGLV